MSQPSTGEAQPRQVSRAPLYFAGVGLLLLGSSALSGHYLARPSSVGKLVPKQALLTWRSPVEKRFRPLSIEDTRSTFELRNVGGQPVHILELTSSCGCATPKIDPTTIAPGATGTVEVQALPFPTGEKVVAVTLRTDSPESPEIVLRLKVIGSRRPPYLLTAIGDLSFDIGPRDPEACEIFATSIEVAGTPPTPPLVKTDVPVLKPSRPTLHEEKPYVEAGTVDRKYRIEVKLAENLAQGAFAGDLLVVDPWDNQHVERLRVHGEVPPMLKAMPARVILRAGGTERTGKDSVSVSVVGRDWTPDLEVEREQDDAPFSVSRPVSLGDGRRNLFTFTISLKAGIIHQGEFRVRVGRRSSADHLMISVAVRVEGQP